MILLTFIVDKSLGCIFYRNVCKVAGSPKADIFSLSVLLLASQVSSVYKAHRLTEHSALFA